MKRYPSWSVRVKTRDNYTCVICGSAGEHAHHIKPAGYNKDVIRKVDNGITLCTRCHVLAHRGTFSPVGFGKIPEDEAIRILEDRAQNPSLHDLIVRIVEADADQTRQSFEKRKNYHKQDWIDKRGWAFDSEGNYRYTR